MAGTESRFLQPDLSGIDRAAALLRAGGLVAFPTETVYGLGADARNDNAVSAIYETKGRPAFNPLIVHLCDIEAARAIARVSPQAAALAAAFWPGPLTLVLPLKDGHGLSALVTAGLPTVALRVPAHPVARKLLRAFDGPLAAPSANPSGRISPTTAAHVAAGFAGNAVSILDAGPCAVGLESTIVAPGAPPRLLRAGGISAEEIEAVLGETLASPPENDGTAVSAPGQLSSHYAPRAPLRLNVRAARPDEVLLGFGPMEATLNLSWQSHLQEAAANLFDFLHRLDATGAPIAVAPIPDHGLGRAINDRLRRAAAPRATATHGPHPMKG